MLQRVFIERRQHQLKRWGIVGGALGEVGPAQVRRTADRGEQIAHQRQVEHLLHGDAGNGRFPAPHRLQLVLGEPLVGVALEAEGGKQVAAQQPVL